LRGGDGGGTDTRSRLLVAAIELFGARGFDSTTMKDLGAHAGVGAPAAYNHFASKDEILVEAVTWAMEAFADAVTRADVPTAPALERLERVVVNHVLWQIEHFRLARANDLLISSDLLLRIGQREAYRRIRGMLRAHLDLVTGIIEQIWQQSPQPKLNARLCALAIGSICDDVVKWYRANGKSSPEEIAATFWGFSRRVIGLS